MSKYFTVAIFLVDKAYGGPEEGGWWFYCGEPSEEHVEYSKTFFDKNAARKYVESLDPVVNKLNEGRYSIDSVLSEGEFAALICEGDPKPFPEKRPHYS